MIHGYFPTQNTIAGIPVICQHAGIRTVLRFCPFRFCTLKRRRYRMPEETESNGGEEVLCLPLGMTD